MFCIVGAIHESPADLDVNFLGSRGRLPLQYINFLSINLCHFEEQSDEEARSDSSLRSE